jgi:hypothetical protein
MSAPKVPLNKVWKYNACKHHIGIKVRLGENETIGPVHKPEESRLTDEEFAKTVHRKSLIGIYGPAPD